MPSLKRLDLSQPWNSDRNQAVISGVPLPEWTPFARDVTFEQPPVFTHILALRGKDSIWDSTTGLPKGPLQQRPDAVLLVSVPESDIEPLEPRDITEEEVRQLVENGKEVFFISAQGSYDVARVEKGQLVFASKK